MSISRSRKIVPVVLAFALAFLMSTTPASRAADHGDGIAAPLDRPADITDIHTFLDPNDNSRLVLMGTYVGFIVPGQNEAYGFFDPLVRYSFGIENTGDKTPDLFLDVTFTKPTSRALPQTATITLSDRRSAGSSFSAPATLSSVQFVAPPRTLTTDSTTGITFFAGLSDDPFFFDVPAEIFYRDSRLAGTTPPRGTIDNPDPTSIDPSVFNRARDTFAGYNVLAIALSVPVERLKGPAGNVLGIFGSTARNQTTTRPGDGNVIGQGDFIQVDAMSTPVVNVVLVSPYTDRDRFNALLPDSSSFAEGIVHTLRRLQTKQPAIDKFTDMIVANGDYLRIDTSIRNTGSGGGTNEEAAFPNGRRLADDVTRTIISIINNLEDVDDGVTENDVPFLDEFPFVPLPNQPLEKTHAKDRTQN